MRQFIGSLLFVLFVAAVEASVLEGSIEQPKSGGSPTAESLARLRNAVVIVQGDASSGTGFIARIRDKLFVVTNLHVLSGNSRISIQHLQKVDIKIDAVFAARGHDVAICSIASPLEGYEFLEVEENVEDRVEVGEKILILGNSLGHGTILMANGEVKSIGPKLIEHDAATFHGNSGSPMISLRTFRVLGVDTLSRSSLPRNWADRFSFLKIDSPIEGTVRLFGYRVDSVESWERIEWSEWKAQYNFTRELERELVAVNGFISGNSDWMQSERVSKIAGRWGRKLAASGSAADSRGADKDAIMFLRSHVDILRKRADAYALSGYDFFREDFQFWSSIAAKEIELLR